jgi:hypothetical protein
MAVAIEKLGTSNAQKIPSVFWLVLFWFYGNKKVTTERPTLSAHSITITNQLASVGKKNSSVSIKPSLSGT